MSESNERQAISRHESLAKAHISKEQLERYLRDLLPEQERAQIDHDLAQCEECLQLFLSVVEADMAGNNGMPQQMPDMDLLEQRVVSQLMNEQQAMARPNANPSVAAAHAKPSRRRSWLQHPVAHYTIAASITLLLLGSGAFAALSERLAEQDLYAGLQQEPESALPETSQTESWSEKVVNQTGSWLEGLQAARFK
ncbi:hypothetical protein [Paenibacillus sp. sgz302251]|uniref:hypothetical protein n=1 Tax=Paenibacillus sp. sgz302251 TaxID=3414493 RepID=UPI003C7D9464